VEEIGGAGVGLERGVGWEWDARLGCRPEPHHDAGEQQAGALVGETFFEGVLAGGAELGEVGAEESFDLGGDGRLLGGTAELLEDVLEAAAVVA
jgi:hypothetical protein